MESIPQEERHICPVNLMKSAESVPQDTTRTFLGLVCVFLVTRGPSRADMGNQSVTFALSTVRAGFLHQSLLRTAPVFLDITETLVASARNALMVGRAQGEN